MTQSKALIRAFYGALGLFCVAIGFVGIVTPIMPGFVFFLIALWAFRRSSSRLELWLLNNRYVGQTLRDWEEHRSMRRRTKIVAIGSIWIAILLTCWRITQMSNAATKPTLSATQISWISGLGIGILLLTAVLLTRYLIALPEKQVPSAR